MYLFHTHVTIDGKQISLTEPRVIQHMTKVLRMKEGDRCMVQWDNEIWTKRYTIELTDITKKQVQASIIDTEIHSETSGKLSMIIGIPNKLSKIERMIQKLTEVGVDEIILRKSQRAIIKDISDKKMERFRAISLESVEQCKRRTVPELTIVKNIIPCLVGKRVVVFDFQLSPPIPPNPLPPLSKREEIRGEPDLQDMQGSPLVWSVQDVVWIVGPEGHFGEKDYDVLKQFEYEAVSLGDEVLRTETAAIVGWRWLKRGLGDRRDWLHQSSW